MELPKESVSVLSAIRIGELEGRPKTLAEEIIGEFEDEHSISLDGRDSLFALVKLSKKLNKKAKKDRALLKKMEELVIMCNGLKHGTMPVAKERSEPAKQRVPFERGRKEVELDKLADKKGQGKAEEKKGQEESGKKEKAQDKGEAPAKEGDAKPQSRAAKFLAALNRFNPVYLAKRLVEDYHTVKEARSLSKFPEPKSSEIDVITSRTNLRLLGALALSEIMGAIGAPTVGSIVQYTTGSAYKGILGTIAGDYLPAVISFEIAWWALNRTYYSGCADTFLGKVRQFYRDVLPVHGFAVLCSIPTYATVAILSTGIIAGINAFVPGLAHILPMPVVTDFINGGIAETIYLTLMLGASMDLIVKAVSKRYAAFLKSREEHNGPS